LFDIIHLPNGVAILSGFEGTSTSFSASAATLMIAQKAPKFTPHLTSF
jgi:hypothetical protein